jgi:hypothetical protein
VITHRERALLKQIHDEREARRDEICRGGLGHEEYKELCGYLRGLLTASEILDELLRKDGEN